MITKEFLIKHGLGDFSIDEQEDIGLHIIKRLDNLDQTTYQLQDDIDNNSIEQIESNNDYENNDEVITTTNDIQKNKGDIMSDLTQLDEITETDILDALSNVDGIDVESSGETIKVTSSQKDETAQKHTIEVDSSNMDSVASLLEQLMNNKTLEISIKVKN
jgi:RecJ-like exonuclease